MRNVPFTFLVLSIAAMVLILACATPQAASPAAGPGTPATRPSSAAPALTERERLVEAAKKEGELAIWGNTLPLEEVWKPFREKYPGIAVKAWDADTGDLLLNRLVEEGKAGRRTADIVLAGSDIVRATTLGLLQEYEWRAEGWPNQPASKFYVSYAAFGWLPSFNTNVIPVDQGPKSWDDLALPKWREKSPVTSLSGAEIPFYMAYLWREGGKLNWEKSEKYLTDVIKNNRPQVARGFSSPIELLATGEYGIFLPHLSSSTLLIILQKGAPIAPVPVGKAPAYNRSMGMVKNPAHPNAAKLFVDWFIAESGNLSVIQGQMAYALDPRIARVARANQLLAEKYGIGVDVVPSELFTEENLKRGQDFWRKLLGIK